MSAYPISRKTNNFGVTARVGFWSAMLTGLLAVAWVIALVIEGSAAPPAPWTGIEGYARSFSSLRMLNLIPALLLGWAYIVMMVSLHFYAPEEKKIWSMIGLAFGIMYAVMANINYLIQFVAVRPSVLSGELDGLTIFAGDNPHSVFWALANAYAIQSMSLFFAAWVLGDSKVERWIRGLFIAVGITFPFQFAFNLGLLPTAVGIPVLMIWIVGVTLGSFLLATLFWRSDRSFA